MIGIVRFWPESEYSPPSELTIIEQETLFLEDIIITTQESAPASPPKPEMPVPVPDDEVIDVELELDFELDPSDLTSLELGRGEGESGGPPRNRETTDRHHKWYELWKPRLGNLSLNNTGGNWRSL